MGRDANFNSRGNVVQGVGWARGVILHRVPPFATARGARNDPSPWQFLEEIRCLDSHPV